MCIKCTFADLELLRWELVVQMDQLSGGKTSPEVMETVKDRVKERGNAMLPRIKLKRPKEMQDFQYGEATEIFKDAMLQRRRVQMAAIEVVAELLENEVIDQEPNQVVTVDAGSIMEQGGDQEQYES